MGYYPSLVNGELQLLKRLELKELATREPSYLPIPLRGRIPIGFHMLRAEIHEPGFHNTCLGI